MSDLDSGNLYAGIPEALPKEIMQTVMHGNDVKIERVVSKGQYSEPGFWYDQEQNEWVVLLKGEAELKFDEGNRSVHMTAGAYVNIPAHTRHRVAWTKPDEETIWLAVFY